jgi:hypothetical protein
MSLTENGGNGLVMPVAPMYGGGGYGGGFGGGWGDGIWLILIVLFALGGGCFGGFGGGMGGGNGFLPYFFNNTDNGVQAGFNQAATAGTLAGIQSSITSGFSNAEVAGCNRAMDQMQTAYTNEIASLERNFAAQTANTQAQTALASQLASCCCENRLATANLGADIAREACADRAAVSNALRDVLEATNASTQRILDMMCQDKIDAKNEKIAELQNQLNMATMRESQTAQNAFIQQGFSNEVDALYNRLSSCPVPSTPVYGRTPIFTCNNGCGCGYGV